MRALAFADEGAEQAVRLLANLVLQSREHSAIANTPRRMVCEAAWRAVFHSAGPDRMHTPGRDTCVALLDLLVDDKRLPRRTALSDPNLEREVEEFASSPYRDPLGAVSFQLVHGRVRVAAPTDVAAAQDIVYTYVYQCLINILHRRAFGGWDPASLPTDLVAVLHQVLNDRGWLPEPPAMEAQQHIPQVNIFSAAMAAAARLGADIAARCASVSVSDEAARSIADAAHRPGPMLGLARRDVQEELRPLLEPMLPRALAGLRMAGRGQLREDDLNAFAEHWATELGRRAGEGNGVEWLFPAGPDVPDPPRLLDEALRAIVGDASQYVVGWIVSGIAPGNEPWSLGEVGFLDPDKYDVGHGELARRERSDRPSALARVHVRAGSPEEARLQARPLLESALDVLTFGFSAMQHRSGFRPTVGRLSFVESPDRGDWLARGSILRAERHKSVESADAKKLASAYDQLLKKVHRGGPLTEVQERLIAAFGWYRRARWEVDATRRVLGYWIVLEQFFVNSDSREGKWLAAGRAALLYRTWRELPGVVETMRTLWHKLVRHVAARPLLSARVDRVEQFSGWRTDDFVLMTPEQAEAFVAAVGPEDADGELPRLFVDYVRAFDARSSELENELLTLRWDAQILLERAYAQRNAIVHRGADLEVGLGHLATELERITEVCLCRAAYSVLHDDPPETPAELLAWWSRPW